MYFIYGTEDYLISTEEKRIRKKNGIEPIIFDENSKVEEIIKEIVTIDFLTIKKLIIIRDGEVFTKADKGKKLLKLVEKNISDVTLVFIYHEDKPKTSNPLISLLMSNAISKHFKSVNSRELIGVIKNMVKEKGGTITPKALIDLSGKLPNNLMIINNEVEKLVIHNKDIDEKSVEKAINEYTSDDYFAFANSIINKDKVGIFSSLKDRIESGDDPHVLISQVSSILLLANKVNNYLAQGFSSKDISLKTKIHIFRVKKSKELLNSINPDSLKILILKLSDLDINIKKGLINSEIGLEKFLLDYVK